MALRPQLLDRWGRPVDRSALVEERTATTIGSVRSPVSGYPADGLNPIRLAQILREADHGNPIRYLELAEQIEERDPHYLGVLSTRKRSVSQIDISVEAASDSAEDVARADMVREWLKRDELTDDLFDILDAVGKGYSFTLIGWDVSEGQWMPATLDRQDPRWFRFERGDLMTPVKITDNGAEAPLDPFRYIFATIRAKSGLHLRSGLARVAAWGWMFKAFTLRDWSIFTQTYGQPLRLGKWHQGASEREKDLLFQAVANIAGDCAAIIPAGMEIAFIESKTVGASADLYEKRADWFDRQISKAVLGQTATTDAIAGGHAVGKEHRKVQEDIERADCKALAAILNRDLIRPWMDLEFGPSKNYPRLKIERPEAEDLVALSSALEKLVPLGLEVEASEIRDRFHLSEPKPGAKILVPPAMKPADPPPSDPNAPPATDPRERNGVIERISAKIKRGPASSGGDVALQAEGASTGENSGGSPEAALAARMQVEAAPGIDLMVDQISIMLERAGSLEEFRGMLLAAFPSLHAEGLAQTMAMGLMVADLAGRASAEGDDA
ncbi:DUF935 domain-containing protein [Paracoccus denitrificans]|uniref:DUF935 domain-containing protein n=1 Tax=Paracoccus denitrificans TaxID=266 RepID=UPI003364F2BD